jgi:serine acetyltransferase
VVTKNVPPGKLAVGVPARIREIRPRPAGDGPPAPADGGASKPAAEADGA